ncbi:MAG TPA: nickel-dependent lactate racemase [Anaerolineaceae bacterium]
MERVSINLPYGSKELSFHLPQGRLLALASPRSMEVRVDPTSEIQRALANPIQAAGLSELAHGKRRVVIVADDFTRLTPVEYMVPLVLDALNRGGVRDEQVKVLVALGTHRPMTLGELREHFGEETLRRVQVVNHPWQDPGELVSLGSTPNGTPVSIARIAVEADLLVGLGSIVPHHIPGYSGGAKIIQPGISGSETTGATHYLSTRTRRSYLGLVENPVRAEMEGIARQVGLSVILNTVLDASGRLIRAFYGDLVGAHRAGVALARQVYGVPLPGQADIVIAGSHPCDLEFWQAHKALYPADMAVKPGGTIVVVTPCPEGVAVTHAEMLAYTATSSEQIDRLIRQGAIRDIAAGALALAWAKVRERAKVYLVSDGISPEDARALGFVHYSDVEDALEDAVYNLRCVRKDEMPAITVLTHAPDMLPLLPE